jgi:hypothetical protein
MRVAARHEVTSRWPRCSFLALINKFLACANKSGLSPTIYKEGASSSAPKGSRSATPCTKDCEMQTYTTLDDRPMR